MGFPNNITNVIMSCIRTVTFSILINGDPTDPFHPKRGIRQGDPLSPYLFILYAEILSGLIAKGQQDGKIHSINIASKAPSMSHLLYVDDSILFCRANPEEAQEILNILNTYQAASGQRVNMEKSEMVFTPNTSITIKQQVQAILPIKTSDSIKKYLGMPT